MTPASAATRENTPELPGLPGTLRMGFLQNRGLRWKINRERYGRRALSDKQPPPQTAGS